MSDPYDIGARAVAATIYRGRRDIAGDRVGWDDLPDSDKAACLALARPVVDAVLGPLVDFPDQTCGECGREHPGADCAPPTLLEEL
jgi:hypothetical protein